MSHRIMGNWKLATVIACPWALMACPGSLDNPELFLVEVDGGPVDAAPDAVVQVDPCAYVVPDIISNTGPTGCARTDCHAADSPAQSLDLESADLIGRLGGVTSQSTTCNGRIWIDTTDPAQSLLYTKLNEPAPCGSRMPFGPPLAPEDAQCVLDWLVFNIIGPPDAGVQDAGFDPVDTGVDSGVQTVDAGVQVVLDIEAEAGDVRAPFVTRADGAASGGQYVLQEGVDGVINRNPDDPNAGVAVYAFNLAQAGQTIIWARTRAATFDNNSFWVRVDDGEWLLFNDFAFGSPAFQWDDVHDTDNPDMALQMRFVFDLTAGAHEVRFAFREPNAQLDRILITQDLSFTP